MLDKIMKVIDYILLFVWEIEFIISLYNVYNGNCDNELIPLYLLALAVIQFRVCILEDYNKYD